MSIVVGDVEVRGATCIGGIVNGAIRVASDATLALDAIVKGTVGELT